MKIFISLLTGLVLLTCGGPKAPNIKIKTGVKGNKITTGTQLNLSLNTSLEAYTVNYFLNDQPIENTHLFSETKLGDYEIKAVVSHQENTYETTTILTHLASDPPKLYSFELIHTYPHDITAYTQGLEFEGDLLYESTGLYGKSTLRTVDFNTGELLTNKPLDAAFFGEGLTLFDDLLIQLTWKAQKGFVYNKTDLSMQKSFPYDQSKEGWGLCNDGSQLYKSDGTEKIWILDPQTFNEKDFIQVMTHKSALKNLNELEWVNGKIYANTYQFEKDVVVIINPTTGAVEGVVDFSGLKQKVKQHTQLNVLNGIAYHPVRKTFFVTGKNWNKLFEVKIVPKS